MTGLTQFCTKCKQEVLRDGPCVRCGAPDPTADSGDVVVVNDPESPWHTTYDAGTDVTTVNVARPELELDMSDESDAETFSYSGAGTTGWDGGDDWELPSTAAVYDWAQQVDAQQKIYADVVRYDVHWHWLVLPGQHVSRVAVGGDPEMGGSTEADIPAIIAVAETGSNRNADLVVIDSITPASAS